MKQILSTFARLQEIGVSHCDIKPENILLKSQNGLEFKIADIGSARKLDYEVNNTQTLNIQGTITYFSPELLEGYKTLKDMVKYNAFKSDVFSLGLCFVRMLINGKLMRERREQMPDMIFSEVIEFWLEQLATAFNKNQLICRTIKRMLSISPAERPDFIELNLDYLAVEEIYLQELQKAKELKTSFETLFQESESQLDNKQVFGSARNLKVTSPNPKEPN